MKRKDIEKAAGDYSGSSLGFTDNNSVMAKHKAFVDGAEWRINIVWHDSTEKPMPGQLLLVRTLYGGYDLCYYGEYVWNTVMTWSYVKDLIPNTEE